MLKDIKIWIAFISLIAGFILGRCTITQKERVTYVQGKVIRDTINRPKPYAVFVSDTVKSPASLKVDTVWVVQDYSKQSLYRETLFKNDTLGECTVEAIVQYNALQRLSYTHTPVIKNVSILREKVYTPFASISVSTFGMFSVGAGMFYRNIGAELRYNTDFSKSGVELGAYLKF